MPRAKATSWLPHPTEATRSGFSGIVVVPSACVISTGKVASRGISASLGPRARSIVGGAGSKAERQSAGRGRKGMTNAHHLISPRRGVRASGTTPGQTVLGKAPLTLGDELVHRNARRSSELWCWTYRRDRHRKISSPYQADDRPYTHEFSQNHAQNHESDYADFLASRVDLGRNMS